MPKPIFEITCDGSGTKAVRLFKDKYSMSLLTTNNGYQWGGAMVDDEIIDLIIDVLNEYKQEIENAKS